MTEFEKQCYGMTEQDIREQYLESITAKLSGTDMVVAGILSDVQEMLAVGYYDNDTIRKQLNIAKFCLFEQQKKAAFKEGFERAADLYAPNDGQEPYAYEVWDVQDQSFTMIYATQLKEFHWIEPENIARVLYAAPVRTKDLTDEEIWKVIDTVNPSAHIEDLNPFSLCRAVIAADREKNK